MFNLFAYRYISTYCNTCHSITLHFHYLSKQIPRLNFTVRHEQTPILWINMFCFYCCKCFHLKIWLGIGFFFKCMIYQADSNEITSSFFINNWKVWIMTNLEKSLILYKLGFMGMFNSGSTVISHSWFEFFMSYRRKKNSEKFFKTNLETNIKQTTLH